MTSTSWQHLYPLNNIGLINEIIFVLSLAVYFNVPNVYALLGIAILAACFDTLNHVNERFVLLTAIQSKHGHNNRSIQGTNRPDYEAYQQSGLQYTLRRGGLPLLNVDQAVDFMGTHLIVSC